MFTKMSDCIPNDENEKIQGNYQVLLPPEQFQVAALEGGKSMQQGTPGERDFYEQVKEANRVNKEPD